MKPRKKQVKIESGKTRSLLYTVRKRVHMKRKSVQLLLFTPRGLAHTVEAHVQATQAAANTKVLLSKSSDPMRVTQERRTGLATAKSSREA